MIKIKKVAAREILDSRGNPTIEVDIHAEEGGKSAFGRGVAPSGASTGAHEAIELRDNEKRYGGKGVMLAVRNVMATIAKEAIGKGFEDQKEFDEFLLKLDGTVNKSNLGANTLVAASMAFMQVHARVAGKDVWELLGGKDLPQPMFNIINGGKHAGGKLSIQEFMIMPKGETFKETIRMASEIYHVLGKELATQYGASARNVGDEGGFAPPMDKCEDALIAILNAVEKAGYGRETTLALDSAASSFYDGVKRTYLLDGVEEIPEHLVEYYAELVKKYPITSIEDPFEEEDFESHARLLKRIGGKAQIVGDDLLVTNPKRIAQAIEKSACNALLLKVNQIGTVSEAQAAAALSVKNNWKVIVSHRSGETEDTFIADFAAGIGAEFIKTGAPARGERTAKYNQLLRIEERLKTREKQ